jgi:cysteinyl-tRNA synthetase
LNAGSGSGSVSGSGSSQAGSGSPTSDAGLAGDARTSNDAGGAADAITTASGSRGFPVSGLWVSWYGSASGVDLAKVAATFRIINIDADGNFTNAQIRQMQAGGQNRVISYLNLGSCEKGRSYYSTDPPGHKSCANSGALTTPYAGYPDEMWANLSNPAYQDLMVNSVAVNLAAHGVDGFYLDNLEVVEHGASTNNGPCDATCSQGGLDLVWQLRQKFPNLLIVMQNATSDVTRLGMTHGVPYPSLLDGVSHEEVYSNGGDQGAQMEMAAWLQMHLMVNGRPFWLATEDYVGSCAANTKAAAQAIMMQSTQAGFSPYVTDASGSQNAPCFWSDFP